MQLRKELNLFDAIAIVVGTVIGSGVFLVPSLIAAQLHSLGTVLLVWVIGGTLSLFGALSLAELGSTYPGAGGIAVYLRHAYGPLPSFLYGWALILVIHSGSIAGLAVAFGMYASQVLLLNTIEQKALSAGCILALTTVSCLGIRGGKLVQNVIAVTKISALAAIILLLGLKGSRPLHLIEPASAGTHSFSIAAFGVALIAVLWVYEGWHVISFVAGEMKRPQVDLPRGLFYGTALVTSIYVLANLGYYHCLSPLEIEGSEAVASSAVGIILGPIAKVGISFIILVSLLGSMNGLIVTGPRVYYALAVEGTLPKVFAHLGKTRVPIFALIVQGFWAALLAVSGNYQQLFTNVIFTAWIFYGLAVAGILIVRRMQPQLKRGFRVPGYPWVPLLFSAAAAALVINTVIERPGGSFVGIGVVASGLPVYFLFRKAVHSQE